eukprot:UN00251
MFQKQLKFQTHKLNEKNVDKYSSKYISSDCVEKTFCSSHCNSAFLQQTNSVCDILQIKF